VKVSPASEYDRKVGPRDEARLEFMSTHGGSEQHEQLALGVFGGQGIRVLS
jgi:hypothetical protein